jgi:isopenicillin N synthase-like dioxygenase
MDTLKALIKALHIFCAAIFRSLAASLMLPVGSRFEDFHRPHISSPDILRLLKYLPQKQEERGPPMTPHTDLGTLTLLFTRQPGLQVLPAGTKEWRYVVPREGHAVVNLGDQMSLLTSNVLQTCLHRVVPLPGTAMETRYSFAYLMRAEDDTPLCGLKSDLIPAGENSPEEILTSGQWLAKKFNMLRYDTHKEKQKWIITGQREPVAQ